MLNAFVLGTLLVSKTVSRYIMLYVVSILDCFRSKWLAVTGVDRVNHRLKTPEKKYKLTSFKKV